MFLDDGDEPDAVLVPLVLGQQRATHVTLSFVEDAARRLQFVGRFDLLRQLTGCKTKKEKKETALEHS